MTWLDLYDDAVSKLLERGTRAADGNGTSYLRAPDGSKCLLGLMLPDDLYHKDLEGSLLKVRDMIADHYGVPKPAGRNELWKWLTAAQRIHDHSPVREWPRLFAFHRSRFPGGAA